MSLKNVLATGALGLLLTVLTLSLVRSTTGSTSNTTGSTSVVPVQMVPSVVFNTVSGNVLKSVTHLNMDSSQVLSLEGVVDSNAIMLAQQLTDMAERGKPVYLLINSPGGSVLAGATLVSAIEASKVPVYTVCTILCASMAAIIHQYGTKRYMADRAILMFHDASGGAQGTIPQMISQLTLINDYTHKMDAYIAKRTGQTQEAFQLKLGNQIWIDNDESLASHYSDGTVLVHVKGFIPMGIFGLFSITPVNNLLNLRWE